MKFNTAIIVSFLFLAEFCAVQSVVLDISKFGGAPNSDITLALGNAWKEACASTTASKIVIPGSTYKMGGIELKGPCKAPIEVQVDGTIQAPADPSQIKAADQWVKFLYMDHLTLSGKGVFDGQGATAYKQAQPAAAWSGKKGNVKILMNLGFMFVNNSMVTGVTSKDSKNFHVMVLGCNNITFDGFTVTAPADSPNTDGIHMGRSTDVKILNTNIGTGDDCVSLGDGSRKITVQGVKCGPGHGISVGSLGRYTTEDNVEGVTVKNCTLTATQNGVRIKTWPDAPGTITVSDIHFEDITMNNVLNPIIIDQEYCPWNACNKKVPSKVKLSKISFKNIQGTSGAPEGVVLVCSSAAPCDGVELNNVDVKFNGKPAIAKCSNVKPIVTGTAPVCQAPGASTAASTTASPAASTTASPAGSTTATPAAGKAPAGKSPAK